MGKVFKGIFGGGGGGSPAYPIGAIQRVTQKAIDNTQADGTKLIDKVNEISRELERKINEQADLLKRDLTDEEKQILTRISDLESSMNASTGVLDNNLRRGINAALGEFNTAASLLDERDRQEFNQALGGFRDEVKTAETALDQRASSAIDRFDTRTTEALDSYRSTTGSLADTFNNSARGFMDEYRSLMDQAGDLSPERLSLFTRAADFISQSAVDTRAKMLASADPRALELSAIADENAAAMMSGRIGADVQANLARSSAMRALQGGFGASSEMGRGLTARDLGLTSLDLQQRGTQDFERQRALNYNTRVAGLQQDAGQMLAADQARLERRGENILTTGIQTAESDRNFRGDAATRILGGELAREETVRQDQINLANSLFGSQATTAANAYNTTLGNLGQRTARQGTVAATNLSTQAGLAGDIYGTGINNMRTQFGTRANTYGQIYQTNANAAAATRSARAEAASGAANQDIATRTGVFGAVTGLRSNQANTMVQAYQNQYAEQMKRASEQNAGIGSLIGGAGSLIGGTIGLVTGGPIGAAVGSTLGGMVGSTAAGSLGYGGYTGGAQGAQMGSSMMGFLSGGFNNGGSNGGFGSLFGGRNNYQSIYGPATGGSTGLATPSGWSNWSNGV